MRNPHAQLSLADDPYRIAFLRGGALEAVKIAAIVLVDRGLLRADGPLLETASADSLRFASHDIERDVLRLYLGRQGHSKELAVQADMLPSCRAYQDTLTQQELLVGPPLLRRRERITWAAHYLLLTVAAVKAVIAISRQHYNLLFLALLLAIFLLMLRGLRTQATSWSAQRLLTDLRMLFGRLNHARIAPAGGQQQRRHGPAGRHLRHRRPAPVRVRVCRRAVPGAPAKQAATPRPAARATRASGGGDGGGDGGGSGCGGCGGGGGCGS